MPELKTIEQEALGKILKTDEIGKTSTGLTNGCFEK